MLGSSHCGAQRYKFDDYEFDQNIWLAASDDSVTTPGATTITVHIAYKSRSRQDVMESYEKFRRMFFDSALKAGKFYYKSDTEYTEVNILSKKEILNPKGKGYYAKLQLVAEDSVVLNDLKSDDDLESEIITPSMPLFTYQTQADKITPTPFLFTLNIKTAIKWIKIALDGKNMGFQFSLIAEDVVKIDSATGQVEIYREDSMIRKIYADGTLLKVHSDKNEFMFVTDVEDPLIELFECDIDVTEEL